MKLCFSNLFCMEYSAKELQTLCAKHGIDGVELRATPDGTFPYDDALNIVDIGTGVCLKGYDEKEIKSAKQMLDKIKETNIKAIRVFLGNFFRRFDEPREELDHAGIVKALQELCDFTQKEIWVETHNEYATGAVLKKLISEVGRKNLKIIWDIVHPIEDGEKINTTYTLIGEHIAHIHIKDAKPHTDAIWHDYEYTKLGQGILPIREVISLLSENGYAGYYSLEWESLWREELKKLKLSADEILEEFVLYVSEKRE
ncbi:MAG: sugar phosphate isomerase/epimerase [Ruminococcaceae bacterium]|nr:sugar phosphate isomerase/epimerase [Oscillospiraceae bacterium]